MIIEMIELFQRNGFLNEHSIEHLNGTKFHIIQAIHLFISSMEFPIQNFNREMVHKFIKSFANDFHGKNTQNRRINHE